MTGIFIHRFSGSFYSRLILFAAVLLAVSSVSAQYTGAHIDLVDNNYSNNYLSSLTFSNIHTDGNGGAINALNSDIYLTNAAFTGNTAKGLGGAIYFKVDSGEHFLQLVTTADNQTVFSGNKQNYDPQNPASGKSNSLTFAGSSSSGTSAYAYLDIGTEGNSILRQEDPMAIDPNSTDFRLYVAKYGTGTWQLGGISDFSSVETGDFDLYEGTLEFIENGTNNNAGLKLNTSANTGFYMSSGTNLEVAQGINTTIETGRFYTGNGSTVHLLGNLELLGLSSAEFGGTLTGSGNLTVRANGTNGGNLYFYGETSGFSGDFTVGNNVTLALDTDNSFVTANGTLTFQDNSALSIKLDEQEPRMKAKNIVIGSGVNLITHGILQDTGKPYVVLESDNVINGVFANEGSDSTVVDYLSTSLQKSTDRKQYLLTSSLNWNLTNGNAHGTFTVEENTGTGAPGEFTVAVPLSQNNNPSAGWNGLDLTKKGTGILELAAKNNIGNAIIEDGTLRLTHSQALNTNKKVLFNPQADTANPILELNFQDTLAAGKTEYTFGTQVGETDGIGTLVKKGDNTVLMTNAKNRYGNTEINEGTLAIASQDVLGSGKVTFTGGTLQYRSPTLESFDVELEATPQGNIKLDTPKDMRITGNLTGSGGLIKTGDAELTLAGNATYTGNTEVLQGTLALEKRESIGSGLVILDDGAVFQNTTKMVETNEELLEKAKEISNIRTQRDEVLYESDIDFKDIHDNSVKINLASAKSHVQSLTSGIAQLEWQKLQAKEHIEELEKQKGQPGANIEYLTQRIAEKKAELAALDKQIERNDNLKTTLETQISNKDNLISELHKQISDIDEEIALLQKEHDGLTQDFVLNASSNGKILNGNTIDTQEDLQILGTVSGNGMLVKKGEGKTLTLSGTNTYTGGTKIDEGTVAISRKDNLGTGDVIFNGGTLKNTAAISNFNNNIITNRNKNAIFETENDLTIKGVISGSGGLIKTGDAELALYGNNSYTGGTLVQNGTLAVNGKSYSDTTVKDGAILRGKGTIAGNVKFESGSAYEWYAGHTLAEKDCLTVLGNVELNNTAFLAVTAGGSASYFQYDLNGQEVLKYDNLTGDKQFASVNNDYSPFYIFTLDYSEQGVVKVLTHKRSEALGLSDGVAVGLNMAQRRAHRRPFDHIDFSFRNARYALPETLNGTWIRKHQQALETGGYRGQNVSKTHNAWGDIYIRGTQYDSTFFTNDWKMCSVGFQGGYSFYADQNLEWGLTVGAECPELKNSGDKITMSDGYLGLYYGQRLQRNWEFKGYVGGGTQRYESKRFDAAYTYKTRYYGESFQANVEFARPLRTPYFVLRPLAGFDFEYVQQEAAYENRPGQNAEQRYYSKASLTQLFTKVGLDFQRPIRCGDAYFGISYSNMIAGDSQSVVGVYYPKAGMSGKIRAASLGQNIFTFRLGANHYLNGRDYSILYWNFTADEYADRFGGKGEFSGTVGYSYRF